MASFDEIINAAQQRQPMPATPMPFVPGMPRMQNQAPQLQTPQIAPAQPGAMPAPQAAETQQQQTPVSPEEFEQRKQSWKAVLDGFMAQPNAKELMMMVGLKLMQGRRPGQSVGSQFAEAAGTGLVANQMYKQNLSAAEDKQRERSMEDQKFNLDIRRGTAQADKAEAENDFYNKTRAQALEEINLGIQNLKNKGRLDEARLAEQEFQNGNLKQAWDLTVAEKKTAIADRQNSMWARGEQLKISRTNANKVPAAGQAKKDLEDLVRRANPIMQGETAQAYDQRIAQATLGIQSTSKSNSATDWTKYADTLEDGPERDYALAQARALLEGRRAPSASAGPLGMGPGRGGNPKADWIARAQAANPGVPLAEIQRRANAKFGK